MKTLSTIANVTVVESQDLDFAVEVSYLNPETNVTARATVVNTDMHGEDSGILVGTVMSKRNNPDDVVVHPVARDTRGRFVSLKGTKHSIEDAAKQQLPHVLNVEVCFEVDDLPQAVTPMAEIIPIIVPAAKSPVGVGRRDKTPLAAPVLPPRVIVTEVPVVVQEEESVVVPAASFEDAMDSYQDEMELVNPMPEIEAEWLDHTVDNLNEIAMDQAQIIPFDVNAHVMQEHAAPVQVDEVFEVDMVSTVKKACRRTYDFFFKEMRINGVNPSQMQNLLCIIWNTNPDLHIHKDAVDYFVLNYVMHCYMQRLGKSKFLQKTIVQEVVRKALIESVKMAEAA